MKQSLMEKITRTAWYNMNCRCYMPEHVSYKYYSRNGVKVCDRWRMALDAEGKIAPRSRLTLWHNRVARSMFINDMGLKPLDDSNMQLSRKGDAGNYEPGNVVWDYGFTRQPDDINKRMRDQKLNQ